jgi:hypothetical protein
MTSNCDEERRSVITLRYYNNGSDFLVFFVICWRRDSGMCFVRATTSGFLFIIITHNRAVLLGEEERSVKLWGMISHSIWMTCGEVCACDRSRPTTCCVATRFGASSGFNGRFKLVQTHPRTVCSFSSRKAAKSLDPTPYFLSPSFLPLWALVKDFTEKTEETKRKL